MAPLTPYAARLRRSIAAASLLLAVGCSGTERPSGIDGGGGITCADTRCAAGQVCCIDCDGRGTCSAPGTACAGAACLADGGLDASTLACADATCASGQVCCIDCDGRGTCLAPGSGARCGGETCPPASCSEATPCPSGRFCCDNDCDGVRECVAEGCSAAPCPARDGGPAPDAGSGPTCGSRTCASNELCLARVACPSGEPPEPECIPMPSSCGDAPSCGCFDTNVCGGCATCGGVEDRVVQCECVCICAAPDTPIATPDGERAIASLAPGDLVYSMHRGRLVAVPLVTVGRSPVPGDHAVVRVQLSSGRVLEMSPGHPTADGRRFGDLAAGEDLGGVAVAAVELVPYERAFTHDILPASDTATYVAAGALVGSTLANRR